MNSGSLKAERGPDQGKKGIPFSVVIPLYNKELYVGQTLDSVMKQTVSDFELIVVDDGSTDSSLQIVEGYPRVRLIRQNHQGVSSARNRGIREAKGNIVCFLDADDLWKSNFLETVKELFLKFPEAGAACPSYEVDYGRRTIHPEWKSVDPDRDGYVKDFYEMATAPFWVMNSSCCAVKREVLDRMESWFPEGETVYEDFDFWMRLGSCCRIVHSSRICAVYRRRTVVNARNTNRILFSPSYMKTLDTLLRQEGLSGQQKDWIQEIIDRRMVPYLFSLLLAGERKRAGAELKSWKPCRKYQKYRIGLKFCTVMPMFALKAVQAVRMKVF